MSKPSSPPGANSTTPWIGQDGILAHPDAPRGSGGTGFFKEAGPSRLHSEDELGLPHPNSPEGRRAIGYEVTGAVELDGGQDDKQKTPVYLDKEVLKQAKELVGKPTVRTTTPKGQEPECFDLVDKIYQDIDAQHPDDLTPSGSKPRENPDGDYVWGEAAPLTSVKPGDVLQLRDHKISITVDVTTFEKYPDGTEIDDGDPAAGTTTDTASRGHHTAIVLEVHPNGKLVVAEQHVIDRATGQLTKVVRSNELHTTSHTTTKVETRTKTHPKFGNGTLKITTKTTIKVSGKIFPYRAVKKVSK